MPDVFAQHAAGQPASTIYGLGGTFKFSPSAISVRRRRSPSVIHLSTGKAQMVTVHAEMISIYGGAIAYPGEYDVFHPTGYLRITNTGIASGITPSPDGSFEIPVHYIPHERFAATNIFKKSEFIQ